MGTGATLAETWMYYDKEHCIEENAATGETTTSYVFGKQIDEALCATYATSPQYPQAGTYWHHTNSLGSVSAISDATGAAREFYTYEAYGRPTVLSQDGLLRTQSTAGSRVYFTGREWDRETSLYHMRYRSLSPGEGRFAQRDNPPVEILFYPVSPYTFVRCNPLSLSDPLGLLSASQDILDLAAQQWGPQGPDMVRDILMQIEEAIQREYELADSLSRSLFAPSDWKSVARTSHLRTLKEKLPNITVGLGSWYGALYHPGALGYTSPFYPNTINIMPGAFDTPVVDDFIATVVHEGGHLGRMTDYTQLYGCDVWPQSGHPIGTYGAYSFEEEQWVRDLTRKKGAKYNRIIVEWRFEQRLKAGKKGGSTVEPPEPQGTGGGGGAGPPEPWPPWVTPPVHRIQ
jgi:RHS repeat-associated protein